MDTNFSVRRTRRYGNGRTQAHEGLANTWPEKPSTSADCSGGPAIPRRLPPARDPLAAKLEARPCLRFIPIGSYLQTNVGTDGRNMWRPRGGWRRLQTSDGCTHRV